MIPTAFAFDPTDLNREMGLADDPDLAILGSDAEILWPLAHQLINCTQGQFVELLPVAPRRGGLRLPPTAAAGLRDQLYDGLMLQLRSMPVSLRVDAWVRKEFPGLHGQQEDAARRQLAENQQALGPQARRIAPEKILQASVGMSAAFAAFWGRTLADPTVVVPFRVGGFLASGEKLLRLADDTPEDAANDKPLVQAWGDEIGVTGWFRLIPFEA